MPSEPASPSSPPIKRIKTEYTDAESSLLLHTPVADEGPEQDSIADDVLDELDEDHCTICLQSHVDRTVIPNCSHDFCFECLLVWTDQSRKCPLCAQHVGEYVIHSIRSQHDYVKHFLSPLRTSPAPLRSNLGQTVARRRVERRDRRWGRTRSIAMDALETAIARRRWVYAHGLYAKHVASNRHTRYRSYPAPTQLSASPELLNKATVFIRRELQVWPNLDIEFLVAFILSLMKSIDIRSESAVKLLAEFLDLESSYIPGKRYPNAEHFAHELYSYMRSPYKDLVHYDAAVQYDAPADLPGPSSSHRSWRWVSDDHRAYSRSPTSSPRGDESLQRGVPSRERMSNPHQSKTPSSSGSPPLHDKYSPSHGPRAQSTSRPKSCQERFASPNKCSFDEHSSLIKQSSLSPSPRSRNYSPLGNSEDFANGKTSGASQQRSSSLGSFHADGKGKKPVRISRTSSRRGDEDARSWDVGGSVSREDNTSPSTPLLSALPSIQIAPSQECHIYPLIGVLVQPEVSLSSPPLPATTYVNEGVQLQKHGTRKREREPRHGSLSESVRAHLQHGATKSHASTLKKEVPSLFARLSDVSLTVPGDHDDISLRPHIALPLQGDDKEKARDPAGTPSARERLLRRLEIERRALRGEPPAAASITSPMDPITSPEDGACLRVHGSVQDSFAHAQREMRDADGELAHNADVREALLRARLLRR